MNTRGFGVARTVKAARSRPSESAVEDDLRRHDDRAPLAFTSASRSLGHDDGVDDVDHSDWRSSIAKTAAIDGLTFERVTAVAEVGGSYRVTGDA
jgi:hypothetical protein